MAEPIAPSKLDLLTVYITLVLLLSLDEKLELAKDLSPDQLEQLRLTNVLSEFVEEEG